jgi:sigma-B regulation protein RsbU (phosphoserine phosphatase)
VIFSDGVTEAQNAGRDFFGEARLKECLQGFAGTPAPEVCSRLVETVERFAGLAPQADDLTIALARFMPKQARQ